CGDAPPLLLSLLSSCDVQRPRGSHPVPLHAALPIFSTTSRTSSRVVPIPEADMNSRGGRFSRASVSEMSRVPFVRLRRICSFRLDRKSTRLNSSHVKTSYAVFCLKKKNKLRMEYVRI